MTGLYHGWSREPDTHADFQHNGVPVDDFADEFRHRSKKKNSKPHFKGCPENDGRGHIYIWVPYDPWWSDNHYEIRVCCGCERRAPNKSFRRRMSNDTG